MTQELTTPTTINILNRLKEGVIVVESDGTIQYLNQSALSLLELDQRPSTLYEAVAPYESWQELLQNEGLSYLYMDSGRIEVKSFPIEWNGKSARQLTLSSAVSANRNVSEPTRLSDQLASLNRISQQLGSTLRLADILKAVIDEALTNTDADGGQISLYDRANKEHVSRFSRGEIAPDQVTAEYEKTVLRKQEGLIQSGLSKKNKNKICSLLISPILYEGFAAGLISLHGLKKEAFNEQTQTYIQALANHAAIAIGNAQRFEELNSRSSQLQAHTQQIEQFVESSRVLHGDRSLADIYEDLVYAIQEGMGYQTVILSLIEEDQQAGSSLRVVSAAGLPLERLNEIMETSQNWDKVANVLRLDFALGAAYFIPGESITSSEDTGLYQFSDSYMHPESSETYYDVIDVEAGDVLYVRREPGISNPAVGSLPFDAKRVQITGLGRVVDNSIWVPIQHGKLSGWVNERYLKADQELLASDWHEDDLFVMPLIGSAGLPIGLIRLDSPNNGRRPDINTVKALEIFTNQTATAIENTRLFHNTREFANLLQQLNKLSQDIIREQDFKTQLELIIRGLQSTGWGRVSLTIRDKELNPTMLVTVGLTQEEEDYLRDHMLPPEIWHERLTNAAYLKYQYGSAYFLPADDPWVQEKVGVILSDKSAVTPDPDAWHPNDLLFLPLYDRKQNVMALISLDEPTAGKRPTPRTLQRVELFVQVATPVIENALLYRETQRQLAELQTVNEVSQAISTIIDLNELMENIGSSVAAAYDVDSYYISLYQADEDILIFPLMVDHNTLGDASPISPDVGPTTYIFRSGRPLLIRKKSDWAKLDNQVYGDMSESYLGVPMRTSDQVIGVLAIQDYERPNVFTQNDINTLTIIASQAAVAVENARLLGETLARSQELRTLFEASHAISGTLDQERILSIMGSHTLQVVEAAGYTIYQLNESNNMITVAFDEVVNKAIERLAAGTAYSLKEFPSIERVLQERKPLVLQAADDGLKTPKWQKLLKKAGKDAAPPYKLILLPVMIRDEIYGAIEMLMPDERDAGETEIQLLSAIINQAGVALENAQLFEDTFQRERFFAALGRVSLAINSTFDLPTVLNLICQESLSLFNVDGAYIWQRQEENLVGIAAAGHAKADFVGSTIGSDDSSAFASAVAASGEGTFSNNFRKEKKIQLRLPDQDSIEAALGIPLKKEDEIIGVLILIDQSVPERFGPRDIEQATVFGVQAAIAIQNAQLVTDMRQLNEELDERVAIRTLALGQERDRVQFLLRVTTELTASLDEDRVLNRALELVNEVVNATQGGILLINAEENVLTYRSVFGENVPAIPNHGLNVTLRLDEGLAGWLIRNRKPVIIDDIREDDRWVDRPNSPEHRSVLGVPLISSEEVIGILMLFHKEPKAFTKEQLALVEAAALQVASAVNNAQLYLLIRDQAERLGKMLREEQVEAAKMQAMLESIVDGVLVTDVNGQVILANRPASLILDIPRKQLVGKTLNELPGLYRSAGESWIQTIETWSKSVSSPRENVYLAERLTIEDLVVSVQLSPVFANNQFFGTVSIFRDITQEVEVDRMKSEFVSTVSHELRTPMTSIKGYADLMLMGAAGALSDPQVRYMHVIKSNADRLSMLVNDLLDISRIETGKTELDLRPLDVPQIVEQVVEGHLRGRIEHEDKPMEVQTEMAPSLPLVNADHSRITQVLTNLVDNAFHYTPPNGRITVNVRANGEFVFISITDTGIGISKENQQKIFDRFFRAEDSEVQRIAGTGLGLSIVQSLIEMHGGNIEVQSAPGKGSTFTFCLPLVSENSDIV